MHPPIPSFDSHPCQQSFPVSFYPAVTMMEKATLLKSYICSRVCFSLFAFIFIFYDCPLLHFKLSIETDVGCREVGGEGGGGGERQRGALLKENEENWKRCEGGEMKKANLSVRAGKWENKRKGSGTEEETEEPSVGACLCMKEGN